MDKEGIKKITITRDYNQKTFDCQFEGHIGMGELRSILQKVPKHLMIHRRKELKIIEAARLAEEKKTTEAANKPKTLIKPKG